MTQRRTPGGQGPVRRPGPRVSGARRTGTPTRATGGRSEPRSGSSRITGSTRAAGSSGRLADRPRSANRPAAARRAAAGGAAKRTNAPRSRRYTGRLTVLFAVLIALALGYTYPIRVYLNQQSDIAAMEAAQRAQREHIGELSEQAALWQDPEYIKIQARERFYMVLPGEVPLVVLTDEEGAARQAGQPAPPADDSDRGPWYDTLWSSIQAANEEPEE
ncbi:septum formation initiator family protein [Solwaraspora sp. WMMD1047]|uniref:FtsB family cell division protein n=1 Tax=Solwaraspora sp. WMMD1047 TaxID=3016102 RepID=UPI002418118C|nr:septum formation initiator family protein [Solwaraspora sp. WMMD1047]MDG4828603.1 septum formation initiator family protein [Solwaraspora sp. WMMD1047]